MAQQNSGEFKLKVRRMDENRNPLYMKGNRNVFCPYYSECLNHAAKRHWAYWTCFECQYEKEQKFSADVRLFAVSDVPYYSLSPSLYAKVKNHSL
jgi:hypothetical protein